MISAWYVPIQPMLVNSWNSGVIKATPGNMEAPRMKPSTRNLNRKFKRASAYAAKTPIRSEMAVTVTPMKTLLILAGLQMIPAEVYEAAKVDGATAWQRFRLITLPLVKPALMVAILFRTLDALRMFDLPYILTGGANNTTTLSILVINQIRQGFNSAAALSTITFIIIFLVAFIFVRFLGANVVEQSGATGKGKK